MGRKVLLFNSLVGTSILFYLALTWLASCKHTATSRPLISFRAIAEIYREVGELFELSVVISERVVQKEDEPTEVRLKIVRADGQKHKLNHGAQETEDGVINFKDMHLDKPCLDNCRLQAELILPHDPLDNTARDHTTITIPLRIIAAAWALRATREDARGFKISVTHDGKPVAHTEAKVAVCTPPCLPWGGSTKDDTLFATQSIKLDSAGSWRGKLTADADMAMVYVKIAGRILRQELPADGQEL